MPNCSPIQHQLQGEHKLTHVEDSSVSKPIFDQIGQNYTSLWCAPCDLNFPVALRLRIKESTFHTAILFYPQFLYVLVFFSNLGCFYSCPYQKLNDIRKLL